MNDEHKYHKISVLDFDFERSSYISETDFKEDINKLDLPSEMLRLLTMEDKQILLHQEVTELVNLGTEDEKKEVKISTFLDSSAKKETIDLRKEYAEIFAWSYQDMPRLSTEIIEYQLPMKPECRPVQQKLKRVKSEMLLKIKEEIKKQFDAGFLEVAKFSEWVANIVLVSKKDGKVRMCVDYRDLNWASPKDNFPLSHNDTLVDNTVKNSLFSFMDNFFGYNQIRIALEDREKTTFVTMWGTFY